MLGRNGDRIYWGRREEGAEGIIVVFAWMSSEEKYVKSYVKLYGSLGWNSIVCHANFITLFFPEKAASLASGVLQELVKEIKNRKLPVVFSGFSGGPKGAMYKIFQIIDRRLQGKPDAVRKDDGYDLVKDCICGQIYDSSPVDFTSDLGIRFVLHPSILRMSEPPRIVSWMANMLASGLDSLFHQRFEQQRADYWQTLYSSARMGPVLIMCSENDELAPFNVIQNFVKQLEEQGSDVQLVKWESSPHVGHYKHHPVDYECAVSKLLEKAVECYSQRMQQSGGGNSGSGQSNDLISGSLEDHHKEASSNYSLPSSLRDLEIDFRWQQDGEDEKEADLVHQEVSESVSQDLSIVHSAKAIENWDLMQSQPVHRKVRLSSAKKYSTLRTLRGMQRSRL